MPELVTIKISEFEKVRFKAWLNRLNRDTKKKVANIIEATGRSTHRRSQDFIHAHTTGAGFLAASMNVNFSSDRLGFNVYSDNQNLVRGVLVKYAPYVEFGTGTKVQVPRDVNAQWVSGFRGKGIRNVNLRARPFLFPAVRLSTKEMIAKFKQLGFK